MIIVISLVLGFLCAAGLAITVLAAIGGLF